MTPDAPDPGTFTDGSTNFAHGVEVGIIWARLGNYAVSSFEMTTHFANRKVIERIARQRGWTATPARKTDPMFDHTLFTVDAEITPLGDRSVLIRPNAKHLRVVK